jgi:hypothetical protein
MNDATAPARPLPMASQFLQFQAVPKPPTEWLWQGYLSPGSLTLLTGQWKNGKTTLVAALLHQMKSGGHLLELPVRAGTAIVLTEESTDLWEQRAQRWDFSGHVRLCSRPFLGKPTAEQWSAAVAALLALHQQRPLALLVLDPLALFLPGHIENSSTAMLDFLATLQQLAAAGMAVLVLHHIAKLIRGEGLAARGSGALSGGMDILLELRWFSSPAVADRRRQLVAWSRFDATPRRRIIELNAAGTDYLCLGDLDPAADTSGPHPALPEIFATTTAPLTRAEVLARWPRKYPTPTPATLGRWLDHALDVGLLHRDGTGRKNDAYLYRLSD